MDLKLLKVNGFVASAEPELTVPLILGPTGAGKTALAKKILHEVTNKNEATDPRVIDFTEEEIQFEFRKAPLQFLESLNPPFVLIELQKAPEVLVHLNKILEFDPWRKLHFVLTASEEIPSRFLASVGGRPGNQKNQIAVQQVHLGKQLESPYKEAVLDRVLLLFKSPDCIEPQLTITQRVFQRALIGGFPEVLKLKQESKRTKWFQDYCKKLIHDVMTCAAPIQNPQGFGKVLEHAARNSSRVINASDIAREIEMSYKSAQHYLNILERKFLLRRLEAFQVKTKTRVKKKSKIVLVDTGLMSHLLGLDSESAVKDSHHLEMLIKTFGINELIRLTHYLGLDCQHYYFESSGTSGVDLVIEYQKKVYLFSFGTAATLEFQKLAGFRNFRRAYPEIQIGGCYFISHDPQVRKVRYQTWALPFSYFF